MIFWNHDFVFSRPGEIDRIFLDRDFYIVFEYHSFQPPSRKSQWDIDGLLGWSSILVDQRTRDELFGDDRRDGIRTKGFRVFHTGHLESEQGPDQSVRVFLRPLTDRQPTKTLMSSKLDRLPILPSYQQEGPDFAGNRPIYSQIEGFQDQPHEPALVPPTMIEEPTVRLLWKKKKRLSFISHN